MDALQKVIAGRQWGKVQLADLQELLSNEDFLSNVLVTTEELGTLLHVIAEGVSSPEMVPMVLQAYINANTLGQAMRIKNGRGCNPLQVACLYGTYDIIVPLFSECAKHCPDVITELLSNGNSILHAACGNMDTYLLKFLLSQEVCQPMLLLENMVRDTPLNISQQLVWAAEHSLAAAEKSFAGKPNVSTRQTVERKRRELENARNVCSLIGPCTAEARLAEGQKRAAEVEKRRLVDKEEKVKCELAEVLGRGAMLELVDQYLLSGDQETQRFTVVLLDRMDVPLPPLTPQLLGLVEGWLGTKEKDPFLLTTLRLVLRFAKETENTRTLLCSKTLLDTSAVLLSSLLLEVQTLCVSIIHTLVASKPEDFNMADGWTQPLLLLKHFSSEAAVKDTAVQSLHLLGVANDQPDPGMWSVREVSFWMEYHTKLEKSSEYRQKFSEAGITGLHLLELSPAEMAGLGVKYLSDQKKLSSLIDDLRRMNMRHIVGSKDLFLSYAHINIQFARKLKKALNDALYTVWIDEAGIRAGHKWRNEIADGIHGCRGVVFIMTPRSANSEYCQDELGLAEEYHKPIMTAKLESISEMDPGLKLVIQRRQWIDFTDADKFTEKCAELITAITSTIGNGSGPESGGCETLGPVSQPLPKDDAKPGIVPTSVPPDPAAMVPPELVKKELDQLREEMRKEFEKVWVCLERLETRLDQCIQ